MQEIRIARILMGYSQGQLAKLVGVTQGAISQWEKGLTHPSYKAIPKLSEVLGISLEELLSTTKKAG